MQKKFKYQSEAKQIPMKIRPNEKTTMSMFFHRNDQHDEAMTSSCLICQFSVISGVGEMVQHLRVLAILPEDSVPSA